LIKEPPAVSLSSDHPFDPTRRQFHRFLLAALATTALPAWAAGPDWVAITPPQPGDSPGKIEVLEFFSWGCPHCRDFNPLVSRWAERLPKDVVFTRVPVSFGRAAWGNLARLFYALEGIGELQRLDEAVFAAIHDRRVNLYTEAAALGWVQQQGVDGRRFSDAFKSFSTETRVARAEQLSRAYKVDSVPLLTVAGRYRVVSQPARGQAGMLAVADDLIERVRKERPKSGKH
jgi:thiol:disulfide interchange protein DsbA